MRSRWERWHERGEHAIARREFDERLAALWQALVIAAEPPPTHDPGETALNHPTPGLRSKAFREQRVPFHFLPFGHEQAPFRDRERMDGLHDPAQQLFHPDQKGSPIVAVAPNEFEARKEFFQWRQQDPASLLIGPLSTQHFDSQQVALRIHQGVTLAAPRFFPHIIALLRSTHRACFDD
jgi:hypothetical protein